MCLGFLQPFFRRTLGEDREEIPHGAVSQGREFRSRNILNLGAGKVRELLLESFDDLPDGFFIIYIGGHNSSVLTFPGRVNLRPRAASIGASAASLSAQLYSARTIRLDRRATFIAVS